MLSLHSKGNYKKTQAFLEKSKNFAIDRAIRQYAPIGVEQLSESTPVDTGNTAASWGYEVRKEGDDTVVAWTNSHVEDGVNIAAILDTGHGTGTGGYVPPANYITPAIDPVIYDLVDSAWKEVLDT